MQFVSKDKVELLLLNLSRDYGFKRCACDTDAQKLSHCIFYIETSYRSELMLLLLMSPTFCYCVCFERSNHITFQSMNLSIDKCTGDAA